MTSEVLTAAEDRIRLDRHAACAAYLLATLKDIDRFIDAIASAGRKPDKTMNSIKLRCRIAIDQAVQVDGVCTET